MAFSESLAQRIRDALAHRRKIEERKMFGGLGFMLHRNTFVIVLDASLIVRLGPEQTPAALKELHVSEFVVKDRASKTWVLVASEGMEHDEQLTEWLRRAEEFTATLPGK